MTNPWDRRPDESDKAWIAFVAYRDLGPTRSLPKAAAAVNGGSGKGRVVERWSGRYEWVSRAGAWDGFVDAKSVQPAVAKARAEMAERHMKLGRALQGVAASGLNKYVQDKDASRKLKPAEVAALAKSGVDIERVAAGEPTEIQQHTFAAESRKRLNELFGDSAEAKA